VTSIVDTIRDLFTQQSVGTGVGTALAWSPSVLIVASAVAMATHHRKIS